MQASKITFFNETKLRLNNAVAQQGRQNLRREQVRDFIQSKPTGSKFTMRELMGAAGYDPKSEYTKGYAFIKGLAKSGKLDIQNTPKFRKEVYWVGNEVTIEPIQTEEPPIPTYSLVPPTVQDFMAAVESKARHFAWVKHSDSLREFIAYLKEEDRG